MGARKRREAILLALTSAERRELERLSRSRSAPAGEVERARMLLDYADGVSVTELARRLDTDRSKVYRCIEKARQFGAMEALEDRPRKGKQISITQEARMWLIALASQDPIELGYSEKVWTMELLARHARENCQIAGHRSLRRLAKGTAHKILAEAEISPYRTTRLTQSTVSPVEATADVQCLYQEVKIVRKRGQPESEPAMPVVLYGEKHGGPAEDGNYVNVASIGVFVGIDVHTGYIHGLAGESNGGVQFVQFLKHLHAGYPKKTKLRLALHNHSSHISRESLEFLTAMPDRFDLIFSRKHDVWLKLVEVLFGKMTRKALRCVTVSAKSDLISRLNEYWLCLNKESAS